MWIRKPLSSKLGLLIKCEFTCLWSVQFVIDAEYHRLSASLSTSRQRLAVNTSDSGYVVYDLLSEAPLAKGLGKSGKAGILCHDGEALLAASHSGGAHIWSLRSGALLAHLDHRCTSWEKKYVQGTKNLVISVSSRRNCGFGSRFLNYLSHSHCSLATPLA